MPIVAASVATPLAAASVAGPATFSISTTSTFWEQPYQFGDFFIARYTLVNDGEGPGSPVLVVYAATERLNLTISNISPLWTVSAGPVAYAKTLTYIGPPIAVGESVVVDGTDTGGYFRGTVPVAAPNWNGTAAQRQSNFNIAAAVTPAGTTPTSLDDGNYPN